MGDYTSVTEERSSFKLEAWGEARVVVHTDPPSETLRPNWDNHCAS